jgi:hypothetical protein
MANGVEAWAQMQHGYLRWLREAAAVGERSPVSSRYGEADEATSSSRIMEEAHRRAEESAREAQRIAREAAERTARREAAKRAPTEEIRSAIRESVRKSEAGLRKGTRAATHEESETGTEALPIEDYDSLNVNQVTRRLKDLSVEELERLRAYEAENRGRRSLMDRFERRIGAAAKHNNSGSGQNT